MVTERPPNYDPVSIEQLKKQYGFDRVLTNIIAKQRQKRGVSVDCERVYREVVSKVNPGVHVVFDHVNVRPGGKK